ncbi:MAG TPA: gamma-glutamyltransferase, partial [Lacipirellulaceae bacterium]|nr:gamma-glutamyltransferase [Lacipirellulaceae bacterium]
MPNSAAIASPHREASIAARDMLQDGGNAFDAAVAAVLTLCVVQPHQIGLGGFGGTLVGYRRDQNRAFAIDFDSRAPLAYTPEAFVDARDRTTGYRSISVPAILAGLEMVLNTHGRIGWKAAMAAAIRCAEQGFVVDRILGDCLQKWSAETDAESRAALFPDGNIPRAG